MNEYELKNVNKIRQEIREYEEKNGKMSKIKKAYYIYIRMGQIYSYKDAYVYADTFTMQEYIDKINMYREGTSNKGEAICTDMNRGCSEVMRQEGINADIYFINPRNPLSHCDGSFEVDGKYYFFNLPSDIMRIQTGMKTRNFGISQEQIRKKLASEVKDEDRTYHLYRMNEQNNGKKFSKIPEELIKQWDDEFGLTYKGLYTNEVLELIKKESNDTDFMRKFFETDKPDELVKRKFEFVVKYIGIINTMKNRKVGSQEAREYYIKLGKSLITDEEKGKYMEICPGFIEKNGRRENANIVLIKKESENIWYLYNSETQKFERVKKEKLIVKGVKYHDDKGRAIPIYEYIFEKEKRLKDKPKKMDER